MSPPDEDRLIELLRLLPPAPDHLVDTARELPHVLPADALDDYAAAGDEAAGAEGVDAEPGGGWSDEEPPPTGGDDELDDGDWPPTSDDL